MELALLMPPVPVLLPTPNDADSARDDEEMMLESDEMLAEPESHAGGELTVVGDFSNALLLVVLAL